MEEKDGSSYQVGERSDTSEVCGRRGAREARPQARDPAPPHALKEGDDLLGMGQQAGERSDAAEATSATHVERGFGAVGKKNKRDTSTNSLLREGGLSRLPYL
jgi:hypothetical protein